MTQPLIIRTANGDFDLFGNESIVQTSSIFNLNDIVSRTGEYTNTFSLPLTNNNRMLIEYADFIPSVNTLPYKKVTCDIFIDGLYFKSGFIAIDLVSDVIMARFYSGNTIFYDKIKQLNLSDLNWSPYDHVWNLTNALASNTSPNYVYVYPVMSYGSQTLGGDIVDVRKILPATYSKAAIDLMISQLGYTSVLDFDTEDYEVDVIPFTNKNPSYPAAYLLLNSLDAGKTADSGFNDSITINYTSLNTNNIYVPLGSIPGGGNVFRRVDFNLFGAGSSLYWDSTSNQYNVQAPGVYSYAVDIQASATHNFVGVDYTDFESGGPFFNGSDVEVKLFKVVNNSVYEIQSGLNSSGISWSGSEYMNTGDFFYIEYRQWGTINYQFKLSKSGQLPYDRLFYVDLITLILDTSTFTIDLNDGISFGNPLVYSSLLPKMKCSDLFKDTAIRYGWIVSVNEDTKEIYITNIDKVKENIPNAVNLSDKLDETNPPENTFKIDAYAQNNVFRHTEDKSIVTEPNGTNYTLVLNNSNLELTKDIYISPFACSVNVDFNGTNTTQIDLYNTVTSKFDKDVKPRRCFSRFVTSLFKFTDGTTTSGYIDTAVIWFIDENYPLQSMGFGTSQITKNSTTIIEILQNLRLVKANFNLDIIDIKNLDYLVPVKIDQFQSYFFISSVNQSNLTAHDLTELDLIKLN